MSSFPRLVNERVFQVDLFMFFSRYAFSWHYFWIWFFSRVYRKVSNKAIGWWMTSFILLHSSKHSSWWGLLENVLKTAFVFVLRRRLQDVFIKTNIFALLVRPQDVLIKTNIFVLVIRLQDVFRTFSRRLQGMFKTSSKRIQNLLQKCLQDIFKTSSRCFENVFKTSSRHLQDVLKSFLRRPAKTVICRRPLTTLLRNLWSVYKISKCDKSFSYFSFSLYYTF